MRRMQNRESPNAEKWIGLEVVENGTENVGRVFHAWTQDDGVTGFAIELNVPTALRTGFLESYGDSEHWTVRRADNRQFPDQKITLLPDWMMVP